MPTPPSTSARPTASARASRSTLRARTLSRASGGQGPCRRRRDARHLVVPERQPRGRDALAQARRRRGRDALDAALWRRALQWRRDHARSGDRLCLCQPLGRAGARPRQGYARRHGCGDAARSAQEGPGDGPVDGRRQGSRRQASRAAQGCGARGAAQGGGPRGQAQRAAGSRAPSPRRWQMADPARRLRAARVGRSAVRQSARQGRRAAGLLRPRGQGHPAPGRPLRQPRRRRRGMRRACAGRPASRSRRASRPPIRRAAMPCAHSKASRPWWSSRASATVTSAGLAR